MVAVGSLDKFWRLASDGISEAEFHDSFQGIFGLGWAEVLDVADKSSAYIAGNDVFFSVNNLRPLKNHTLEQLIGEKDIYRPPNIIVS